MELFLSLNKKKVKGIGDWGLGIGGWAQSPIPNPQSPISALSFYLYFILNMLKLII